MAESKTQVSGTGPPKGSESLSARGEDDTTANGQKTTSDSNAQHDAQTRTENPDVVSSSSNIENEVSSPTKKSSKKSTSKVTAEVVDSLVENNSYLKGELGSMDAKRAKEILKKMSLSEVLTGMSIDGKNQKDMAGYKFWQTQPVPSFDEKGDAPISDGPIKKIDPGQVPQEPDPLLDGFEWCELDLTKEDELKEVYELLTFHYVEDANAMFRFDYSQSFLNWALKSPGWRSKWHVGVRATKSRKLVASIFGIPVHLKIREATFTAIEINYLCIHKKLRSKRLAPVLIKEVTRRCYLEGIYQAIYTAGVIVPRPVATCRYFHRPLNWLKLYDVGFSPLPPGSSKVRMVSRNQLPDKTVLLGLRPMKAGDVESVHDLLHRYLSKFDLSQYLSREEIEHWILNKGADASDQQTVWAFVVEDPETGKITEVSSFYCLESSVIKNEGKTDGSEKIKAAYLYYYASEAAFAEKERGYRHRLNQLIGDTLVEAKRAHFDVFNALTVHDNPLFLDDLRFGAGDGQLHYYLYNYRMPPTSGGLNKECMPELKLEARRGVGMVLL